MLFYYYFKQPFDIKRFLITYFVSGNFGSDQEGGLLCVPFAPFPQVVPRIQTIFGVYLWQKKENSKIPGAVLYIFGGRGLNTSGSVRLSFKGQVGAKNGGLADLQLLPSSSGVRVLGVLMDSRKTPPFFGLTSAGL